MVRTLAILIAVVTLASCGWSASVSEERDPYRDEETYSRSVSFSGRDDFQRAQELARARDFEGAIAIYRNVYQNDENDEVKARALLEWARAESSPFNAARDPDAARARLRLIVEDYPDTDAAVEAELELGTSPD